MGHGRSPKVCRTESEDATHDQRCTRLENIAPEYDVDYKVLDTGHITEETLQTVIMLCTQHVVDTTHDK